MRILLGWMVMLIVAGSATGLAEERFLRAHRPIPGQYIVILDRSLPTEEVPALAASLAKKHGGKLRRVMTSAANGFSVEMSEQQARALSKNPNVLVVEENGILEISATVPTSEWHLDRLDQAGLNGYYTSCETGEGVYVYVLDTGVARDHSEFQTAFGSKVLDGISFADDWHPHPSNPGAGDVGTNPCGGFTGPPPTPLTNNYLYRTYNGGHGTAVASLVAGNTVGVAPGAKIVPVKIASCPPDDPNGTQSIVIHTEHVCWGLDSANNPYRDLGKAVVNISFYTPINDPLISSFEYVVNGVIAGWDCGRPVCGPGWGVTVVASANNLDGGACGYSPSRMGYGNQNYSRHVITVGGTRSTDIRWDCVHPPGDPCTETDPGSNFGSCVDIYAPAHNINSASLASATGIRTIQEFRSGTSSSAPIVSGLAAQALQWDPQLAPTHVWSYLSSWSTLLPNFGDPHDPPQDPELIDNHPDVGALKFAQTRPCSD